MRTALIVIAAIIVALFVFSRHPSTSADGTQQDGNGTTTGHLSVVPTVRSVTVSPGDVRFGNCTGGGGATDSTQNSLGYPNGSCSVGSVGANPAYPITITYTGITGNVYVSGSSAVPADGGASWALCSPVGRPAGEPACSGGQGLPGNDQYMVMNFAPGVANAGVLGSSPACDVEFDPGGGCVAAPPEFKHQVQHEGLLLTGPKTWDDHSTSWTVTVTWTAVSPS